MVFEQKFLINESLFEMDSTALLKARANQQRDFILAKVGKLVSEVPMVSTGKIRPGYQYPSSAKGRPDFYLPKYVIRAEQGHYTTRLNLFPASDDPTAVAGSLSIEVQASPLLSASPNARVIPHDVNLRLGYHIPLEENNAEFIPTTVSEFLGAWRNTDPDTDGVLDVTIAPVSEDQIKINAVQNCVPRACNLGTVVCKVSDGVSVALFRSRGKTVSLTIRVQDHQLSIVELTDIHDPQAPGDFVAHHVFTRADSAPEPPLIWFDLASALSISPTVYQSVTPIADMETYLRLYQVLSSAHHLARLEIKSVATVGRRSFRQAFVGSKDREKLMKKTNKQAFRIEATDAKAIRQSASAIILENPGAVVNTKIELNIKKMPLTARPAAGIPATRRSTPASLSMRELRMPVAEAVVQPRMSSAPVLRGTRSGNVERPEEVARRLAEAKRAANLAEVRSARVSVANKNKDLKLHFDAIVIRSLLNSKMPAWVMVEANGEPVLTRRKAECVQYIAPFWFDPIRNADMFDAPEDIAGGLVLLKHELRDGSRSATFFQDALAPRQLYYEPQEFRLARSENSPYAPMVLFHLNEEVDEESDSEDATRFSVTMTYHAKPYIHASMFDAARAEFGDDIVISPIAPSVTSLTIRMPSNDGSDYSEITRDGVEIDFSDGITDIITLSEDEYRQLTTAFQTVTGIGLEGHVDVSFLDGRSGQIPLRIGLRDTIGQVFSSSSQQNSKTGHVNVQLRNRIESPVQIENLPVISLGEQAKALPVGVVPNELIQPAESVVVEYRTDPIDASLLDLTVVPEVSVSPDLLAILSQTTVVQGYADDTFDISVSIDPMFFEFVPEGAKALTAIRVEFQTLVEPVILTADAPSQTVTLQMPLLLFLTNADEAQHYAFAVTNIHEDGPGNSTAFVAGSGNLEVEPNPLENEVVQ